MVLTVVVTAILVVLGYIIATLVNQLGKLRPVYEPGLHLLIPVVQAIVLLVVTAFVLVNAVIDVLEPWIDPRSAAGDDDWLAHREMIGAFRAATFPAVPA